MNQQLMELNNRLEEQVVERTTVLSATNVRLEQEIVERRRIETELRERVCLATLTADVSVDLAQGHDLQNTLQRCLEAIMHHLDVASVQIWTLNHEENILELQASAGIESQCDKLSRRSPLNHSTIGCIV